MDRNGEWGGQTASTWIVTGNAIADGPFEDIPIEYEQDYSRDAMRFSVNFNLEQVR